MQKKINFPLKGSRTYVQGTSMFNAMVRVAADLGGAEGDIDILFKKSVLNPACVMQVGDSLPDESVIARVSCFNGQQIRISLAPEEEMGAITRVAYDEDVICAAALVNGSSILLEKITHSDDIETLVALCKRLHQEHLDVHRKWVFNRYRGRFPLDLSGEVSISIVKKVGNKITCSEVKNSGEKVGEIFFS
jgi:hypothetical protein